MTIKKRQFATLEMHRKNAFLAYVVIFKLGSPCLGKLNGEIGTEEMFDTWRDSNP